MVLIFFGFGLMGVHWHNGSVSHDVLTMVVTVGMICHGVEFLLHATRAAKVKLMPYEGGKE